MFRADMSIVAETFTGFSVNTFTLSIGCFKTGISLLKHAKQLQYAGDSAAVPGSAEKKNPGTGQDQSSFLR